MSDFATYESVSDNRRWSKSKSTGEVRDEEDIYTLEELRSKLDKAHAQVSTLEHALEVTELRNSE